MLRDLQREAGVARPLALVRHAPTRWAVVHLVATRFATLYNHIASVATARGWTLDISASSVTSLADATRPLYEAIQSAQGSNKMASGYLIALKVIKQYERSATERGSGYSCLRQAILKSLKIRLAMVVDPDCPDFNPTWAIACMAQPGQQVCSCPTAFLSPIFRASCSFSWPTRKR